MHIKEWAQECKNYFCLIFLKSRIMKKRLTAILAALLFAGMAFAQKDSTDIGLEISVNMGVSTYFGHPAVSMFGNAEESIHALTPSVFFGISHNGRKTSGLRYGFALTNLPANDESASFDYLNFEQRIYSDRLGNFQAWCDLICGVTMADNRYTLNGVDGRMRRWGFNFGFGIGANYYITDNAFLGLSFNCVATGFGHSKNLPEVYAGPRIGTAPNYTVGINFGTRF